MTRSRIYPLGTPIAPAERSQRRRDLRATGAAILLIGAVVIGGAWGLATIAQAERAHAEAHHG